MWTFWRKKLPLYVKFRLVLGLVHSDRSYTFSFDTMWFAEISSMLPTSRDLHQLTQHSRGGLVDLQHSRGGLASLLQQQPEAPPTLTWLTLCLPEDLHDSKPGQVHHGPGAVNIISLNISAVWTWTRAVNIISLNISIRLTWGLHISSSLNDLSRGAINLSPGKRSQQAWQRWNMILLKKACWG